MDQKANMPRPCDKGSWSSGGTLKDPNGKCVACPTGYTTQLDQSTKAADCEGELVADTRQQQHDCTA